MGLFDKRSGRETEEDAVALTGVADVPPGDAPDSSVAAGTDSNGAVDGDNEIVPSVDDPASEPPETTGVLDEYLKDDEDDEDGIQGLPAVEGDDVSEPGATGDADDDLLSIFENEEEEDVDLSALTGSLEQIDIESLLVEARDVFARLEAMTGG